MSEPTITCPSCKTVILLTESLAAPLVAATRQEFSRKMALKDEEIAKRAQALGKKEEQIAEAKRNLDQEIAEKVDAKLNAEREQLVADEARKASLASAAELNAKSRQLSELQEILKLRDAKLAEAQNAQAELIKKQRELDDARRELELTVQKRVHQSLAEVRNTAKSEAEQESKLKMMEKEQTIVSMQQKVEELRKKAEQGSQQLQGEVLELHLENLLRTRFPFDSIEPVAKGVCGGDVLQRVVSQTGQQSGAILWESKRTKHWSDMWLAKLRDDQRIARAEVSVLVSEVLPKGVESFEVIDGVWVTNPRAALPVATILRHMLVQVNMARIVGEGQKSKTEMVYQYLTGPRFRHRVEAIVEAFTSMQGDLDRWSCPYQAGHAEG